jgi:tetratricopeptide (TPR) repeat protein
VDPRASIIHYPLALAYRATGDARRAEAHMRQRGTTDIGPPDPEMQELAGLLESAPSYEFRGIRALERGQADMAADLFRRGLALEPNTASLRHRLGTMLVLLGDQRGALAEFDLALRLAPDYAPTYFSLGVLLATEGRYAAAAERFAAALTHAPDYLEARLALADMLTATGRPAEALRHFDTVLDVRPYDANATLGRAMALLNIGRQREATEQLREGARRHPTRPEFQQALATVKRGTPRR